MTAGAAGSPGPMMPPGKNASQERRNTSAGSVSPSRFTIDVGRQVAEIEHVLRAAGDLIQCREALAILERWQFDQMLDDASRERARVLVREFAAGGWDSVPTR